MINLAKGQSINLEKNGQGLKSVVVGLGWDERKASAGGFFNAFKSLVNGAKSEGIDLDASCLLFDAQKKLCDNVWFRQLRSKDGSIHHTGDNRTGQGEGDDEQIIVDLEKVPTNIVTLIFTVNSFSGESFSSIENAYCRVLENDSTPELARYSLSNMGDIQGIVIAAIHRVGTTWEMKALGTPSRGMTFHEMGPDIQSTLAII